jgi:glycosyltransferase involved in cell wall biosynthesis
LDHHPHSAAFRLTAAPEAAGASIRARILTNFMNSRGRIEVPSGGCAEVTCAETWPQFQQLLDSADIIVVDCRNRLIFKLAAYFLLRPWKRKSLVAVDIVLRKPLRLRDRASALLKRVLLRRVDHFVHFFRDVSGYTRYFGIGSARSSYVPFKVNIQGVRPSTADLTEEYVLSMGVSLRDYDTLIRAVAELPYPVVIPEYSFERFEGRDDTFAWTRDNLPRNVAILPDSGNPADLLTRLCRARLVVIPIRADSLCASGLSVYLNAMYLGKCVITSAGPGASDLLTDQAVLVPPHDVAALRDAIRRAWEDDGLRRRTAESGRRYAVALGGEPELLDRVYRQCFSALGFSKSE